jgi:hypothetical protein
MPIHRAAPATLGSRDEVLRTAATVGARSFGTAPLSLDMVADIIGQRAHYNEALAARHHAYRTG